MEEFTIHEISAVGGRQDGDHKARRARTTAAFTTGLCTGRSPCSRSESPRSNGGGAEAMRRARREYPDDFDDEIVIEKAYPSR
jgi:hypothetical protein